VRSCILAVRAFLLLSLCLIAPSALAQGGAFPDRAVKLVVPFSPGGSGDVVGRLLADKLSQLWGQPVVVENRAGGSTLIGIGQVARAAPDGYTIGLISAGLSVQPSIRKSMPFDPLKDLDYVTQIMESPFVLTASATIPVKSAAELIAYAKANPGKLNYGSFGVGSTPHILGEILAQNAGVPMTNVAFKGSAEATQAHLRGDIQVNFDVETTIMPHIKAGTIRPILITSARRSPALPDTPTAAQAGMPDLELPTWFGIVAPRGVPPDVMRKLSEGFATVLKMPDVVKALDNQGMTVVASSPDAFRKFMANSMQRVDKVVTAANIPKSD